MEVTASFTNLLSSSNVFLLRRAFQIFLCLMTGWVLSHRRRFVTDRSGPAAVRTAGITAATIVSSATGWKLDTMSWVLARLFIHVLVPTGIIELAVDDTLCRKRGLTIYGTGMHHDPLSPAVPSP